MEATISVSDFEKRYHVPLPVAPPPGPLPVMHLHKVGERLTEAEYEAEWHRPLPSLAQAAAMRAAAAHHPVYSLASESAEQKWAAIQAKRSGLPMCCGLVKNPAPLTHADIAALTAAGTFRRVPYRPPLSPWWYVALGVVAASPLPFLAVLGRRRYVALRLREKAERRARALASAERLVAHRAAAVPRRVSPPGGPVP